MGNYDYLCLSVCSCACLSVSLLILLSNFRFCRRLSKFKDRNDSILIFSVLILCGAFLPLTDFLFSSQTYEAVRAAYEAVCAGNMPDTNME